MAFDYSISFEGIRAAGRSLTDAAYKIANVGKSGKTQNERAKSGDVDLAAALIQADQAKINAEANMKMLSTEQELDQKILDVFG